MDHGEREGPSGAASGVRTVYGTMRSLDDLSEVVAWLADHTTKSMALIVQASNPPVADTLLVHARRQTNPWVRVGRDGQWGFPPRNVVRLLLEVLPG